MGRNGSAPTDRGEPVDADDGEDRERGATAVTRRAAMLGAAGLGLAGIGVGSGAAAEEPAIASVAAAASMGLQGTHTIGRGARARHPGTVVIGDGTSAWIASRGPNEVRSQCPVYAPAFHTTSARAAKTDVEPVDPESVLDSLADLPIYRWRFDAVDDGPHLGPMADDFHDRFDLAGDGETIASVDADGVALAAIQGVLERHERESDRLRRQLDERRARLDALEARLDELEAEVSGGER